MKSYKFLEQIFCKINNLDNILQSLYSKKYNTRTVFNANSLTEQIITIEEIKHEIISDPLISDMINKSLLHKDSLSAAEIMNLHYINKSHSYNSIVPLNLKLALAKTKISHGIQWINACKNNDQKLALSSLFEIVKLIAEIATIRSDILKISKYDTLLQNYSTSITSKDLDVIFSDLGIFFRTFYNEATNAQQKEKLHKIVVNKNKQISLDTFFLDCFKIDKNKIYIEEVDNNFNMRYLNINNPYHILKNYAQESFANNFTKLFAHLGKIIYIEQNTMVPQITDKLIYESSGILLSHCILSSQEFAYFLYPHFKKILSLRGKSNNYENLLSILTRIQPNVLFEKSDEVSSIGHIMLRYTIEKEIINDSTKVQHLPDIFAQGMQFYYNITPNTDQEGFMQDDLWINGIFGYYPCLTISHVMAAEMFNAIQNTEEEILLNIKKGNFTYLLSWMQNNLYTNQISDCTITNNSTNKSHDISVYKKYLVEKYFNH